MPDVTGLPGDDQAAGLRRLFGARAPQVVAFVSGGGECGRTPLLVRTATALAEAGHEVVLVDENAGADSAHSAFGVAPGRDLLELVRDGCALQRVLRRIAPRLQLVAASQLAAAAPARATQWAQDALEALQAEAAFVIVDCVLRRGDVSPLARGARHMAMLVAAQGPAITQAYAFVKKLSREQSRDAYQVVVTRSRDASEARAIFDNLRSTAREHLGVRLDFLGECRVPLNDHLADALLSRLPLPGAETGGIPASTEGGAVPRGRPRRAPGAVESVV